MNRSELGWSFLLVTVIAVFAWWRLSPHPRPSPVAQDLVTQEEAAEVTSSPETAPEPETKPEPELEPTPTPPIPPPPTAPAKPSKLAIAAKPKPTPKPKKVAPPEADQPKSIKELLEARAGLLPVAPPKKRTAVKYQGTDNAFGYFAGYILYADNTVKKMRHQHAYGNFRIAIEEYPGNVKDWTLHDGQLKLSIFRGDPHGLIIDLPDGRLLYLKFQAEANVQGYTRPIRVLTGWLLSDMTLSASVARVAMIDIQEHNREFPPGRRDAEEWPKVASLKALTADLPVVYENQGN